MVSGEGLCACDAGDTVTQLAIIAALPREIAGLVRGTRADAELLQRGIHLHSLPGALVVAAGMGAQRVTVALETARQTATITAVVSTGLAGACTPELRAGEAVEASSVVDARTGERFAAAEAGHVLVTTEAIAGVQEKARLAASHGAALVDMEAATLARLAVAHGLAFRAIKGISDAHDFELASLARFGGGNGHFRTRAFALHTALRPHHWSRAMTLGRESARALVAMQALLRDVIAAEADQ